MPNPATVATGYPRFNVNGSYREWYYKCSIAADEDYLDIPLKIIKDIQATDDTIQAVGIVSTTLLANGHTRVEFNSAGAVTGIYVKATGW